MFPPILVLVTSIIIPYTDGACTIPTVFMRSTWNDNTRGDVTFGTWKMEGWSFQVNGQAVDEWVIVDDTKFNADDGGYIAFRSSGTFTDTNGTIWQSYLCLKFEKVTNVSYKYYQYHDEEVKAGGERVKLHKDDSWSGFEDICDETFTPNLRQSHIMVKEGKKKEARIHCPDAILGRFDYKVYLTNGSVLCNTSTDNWDGCKNTQLITFNYTSCSATMVYSAGGVVQCVDSTVVTVNTKQYTYVVVQNLDNSSSIDNTITFAFACISVTSDSEEMSIVPGWCRPTQVPYEFPEDTDGVRVSNGAKLTNNVLDSCARETRNGSDGEDDKPNIALIVGLSVAGFVLLALLGILICVCCGCRES